MILNISKAIHDFLSLHYQSTIFDVLSAIISGAALLFAILVPVRIANRQNKIALFEKRFVAYSEFLKLKTFASILNSEGYSFKAEDIQASGKDLLHETARRVQLVGIDFGGLFNYLPEKPGTAETVQRTIAAVRACEMSVNMLPLLYSKKLPGRGDAASAEIKEIFESLDMFMVDITLQNGPIDDTNRTDFISKVECFTEKYTELFEKELHL